LPAKVFAADYNSTWFIYSKGDPQKNRFANIRVKYSCPDTARRPFDVDVSLAYVIDANAHMAWIDFYDVAVHLRQSAKGANLVSSTMDTSKTRLKAGEQYARKFTVPLPKEPGSYFVAMTGKTYTPRTDAYGFTVVEGELDYDTGDDRDLGRIPRVTVAPIPVLIIRLQDIPTANVKVDGQSLPVVNGTAQIELSPGQHSVEVSAQVELGKGKRAIFQEWSDADKSNPRQVSSDRDLVLVAFYKTQYLLSLETDKGKPQGAGWYDAGSQAAFSVSYEPGFLIAQVFDHWEGDFSGTSPSATISMDGPKTIRAMSRTDYTQLLVVIALVGAAFGGAIVFVRSRAKAQPKLLETALPPKREPYRERLAAEIEAPKISRAPVPPPPPVAKTIKHCIYCGAMIPDVVTFCTKCGQKQ